MIKITRVEVFPERNEAFINAEYTDADGFFNYGKWVYGEEVIPLLENPTLALEIMNKFKPDALAQRVENLKVISLDVDLFENHENIIPIRR